jgi:hypothetical protein
MKTILFPIDFSQNAIHASEYVGMIAKRMNANVVLMNVSYIQFQRFRNINYRVSPSERGEKSGRILSSHKERGWGDRRSGEVLYELRQ